MANNILKAKKQAIRHKILFLTGDDDTWVNNPEIVREVQRLSTLLNSDRIGDKRPLPRLDPDKLTKEEYQRLLDLGYQVKDIKKALGLGTTTFQNWRMANEIENKIKRKEKAIANGTYNKRGKNDDVHKMQGTDDCLEKR